MHGWGVLTPSMLKFNLYQKLYPISFGQNNAVEASLWCGAVASWPAASLWGPELTKVQQAPNNVWPHHYVDFTAKLTNDHFINHDVDHRLNCKLGESLVIEAIVLVGTLWLGSGWTSWLLRSITQYESKLTRKSGDALTSCTKQGRVFIVEFPEATCDDFFNYEMHKCWTVSKLSFANLENLCCTPAAVHLFVLHKQGWADQLNSCNLWLLSFTCWPTNEPDQYPNTHKIIISFIYFGKIPTDAEAQMCLPFNRRDGNWRHF